MKKETKPPVLQPFKTRTEIHQFSDQVKYSNKWHPLERGPALPEREWDTSYRAQGSFRGPSDGTATSEAVAQSVCEYGYPQHIAPTDVAMRAGSCQK